MVRNKRPRTPEGCGQIGEQPMREEVTEQDGDSAGSREDFSSMADMLSALGSSEREKNTEEYKMTTRFGVIEEVIIGQDETAVFQSVLDEKLDPKTILAGTSSRVRGLNWNLSEYADTKRKRNESNQVKMPEEEYQANMERNAREGSDADDGQYLNILDL